jgi:pyruvate ferredoxin oxidoreductase gamma subunit
MFEVRLHGRGGQGVVTAAELLSVAAFLDGRYAQAFPSFGSERTGAPVVAFCRIADAEIRSREPVMAPDALVVQDATLFHQIDVFAGLRPDGYLLVNSPRSFEELGIGEFVGQFRPDRLAIVGATEVALAEIGRPVPNTVLIAGLAALTGIVSLDSVIEAIRARFTGPIAQRNVAAATQGFERVRRQIPAATDA